MNWNWLGQRTFWVNLLVAIIVLGQYFIGRGFWPNQAAMISVILGGLQILVNMITGTVISVQLAMARQENTRLKTGGTPYQNKMNQPK
jgi:type VI protein secretion system component VasK